MKTDNQPVEALSSMLDGDITDAQLDALLAQLDQPDLQLKPNWALYHQIGDVLRSDDLALPMSADFSARFAQRLAAEPVVLAPRALAAGTVTAQESAAQLTHTGQRSTLPHPQIRRFHAWRLLGSLGGMAAALLLGVSLAPQLTSLLHGSAETTGTSIAQNQAAQTVLAGTNVEVASNPAIQLVANPEPTGIRENEKVAGAQDAPIQIIRDPNLDSYLQAHQKFSPSIGSTARYVRPANTPVAADSQ